MMPWLVALSIAASQGQFELNVYKPLIAHNLLDSQRLLTDAMASFHTQSLYNGQQGTIWGVWFG